MPVGWRIQPLSSFGHYDVRDTNKGSKKISTSKASCRMLLVICITLLAHAAFFAIAGLTTSLNQELGFVTFGVMWFCWVIIACLAAPVAAIIGQKYSLVLSIFCMCLFFASNYYPTWYTLIPGSIFMSIGGGLYWVLIFPYMANTAEEYAAKTGGTADHYASQYFGMFYFAYGMAAVFGSITSSAFLLPDQLIAHNGSFTGGGNQSCSNDTQDISPAPWAVYSLLSVMTVFGILSFLLVCALPKTSKDRVVAPKAFLVNARLYLKSLTQLSLLLITPCMIYIGFSFGSYFGVFTKHFISECVGVGLVGLAVVPWGLSMAFSSLVFGKISIYTPCTVLTAVSITAIQGGILVFLLSWERQPSYVLAFLASMSWGIADGMWLTFSTAFVSAATASELHNATFGICMGTYCIGGTLSYFLAAYIPVFFNLLALLLLMVLGAILYITGLAIHKKGMCKRRKARRYSTASTMPAVSNEKTEEDCT